MDETEELVPEAVEERDTPPQDIELPPEPGTPGDHNDDCLGVDGDAEEVPEGDADDEEDIEL